LTLKEIYSNPLVLTDVYNLSHHYLKENVDYEISHIYNRSRSMILYGFNETVINLLNQQIDVAMVMHAEECAKKMGMKFPVDMWMKLVDGLDGWIPLKVEALPDGTYVPKGTPFAQITNTEEGFGELVTWWEGIFLHSSFPSACATRAYEMREYLVQHHLPLNRLHSFGFRGHRSLQDAYWATTAWNLFLTGTDDFHGQYHCPNAKLGSIPATAHKTIQQFDEEKQGYIHAIDQAKEKGHKVVALVIDTYDPLKFIHEGMMRDVMEHAEKQGMNIVLRPDSGDLMDQAVIIYGMSKFWEFNNVSMIIGEGMSLEKVKEYDDTLRRRKIPLKFMNYGVGSGYYNDLDRDYLGFAMKTSYSNGKDRMKLTKSNPFKRSIPGCVNIVKEDNELVVDYTRDGLFETVYDMDERSSRPKVNKLSWDDIKLNTLTINPYQKEIILSPMVKANIRKFEERYLNEKMPEQRM